MRDSVLQPESFKAMEGCLWRSCQEQQFWEAALYYILLGSGMGPGSQRHGNTSCPLHVSGQGALATLCSLAELPWTSLQNTPLTNCSLHWGSQTNKSLKSHPTGHSGLSGFQDGLPLVQLLHFPFFRERSCGSTGLLPTGQPDLAMSYTARGKHLFKGFVLSRGPHKARRDYCCWTLLRVNEKERGVEGEEGSRMTSASFSSSLHLHCVNDSQHFQV